MSKILVVDDDASNRLLLRSILGYEHHTVIEASSAAEGLARAVEHRPDLIIVDLSMPGVDGVTFVRRLRDDPRLSRTRIALHTGTTRTAAIDDFLQLYAIETLIPKPSDPREILEMVKFALTRS
jgi:CheY-like chemotaxis protein